MIVFPNNWKDIGQPISLLKIENTILEILSEIPCASLALSGGVDSCLLLYYMQRVKKKVRAFTMGKTLEHPDVVYSQSIVASLGGIDNHVIYIPSEEEIKKAGGYVYSLFYDYVIKYTDTMIAGDGIDEFMCGYYSHQKNPGEGEYYKFMRSLLPDHLIPLDAESGDVKVYLPYIDNRLIQLVSQIPTWLKVDKNSRKKIIMSLAKDKLPSSILERWKYGFCDALNIKEARP